MIPLHAIGQALGAVRRRAAALSAGLLLVLMVAGCSSGVRLGYNQAETLVNWSLSDYVEFEPHQRDLFAQRFRALHDWHRRDQLPEYARLLRETRSRTASGLSRADIDWLIASGRGRFEALVERSAADAAELLASLSPDQVDALERSLMRANQKRAREWAVGRPPAEQHRVRSARLISQVERFTGRLSNEQKERIAEMSAALPLNGAQRLAERQRRQREMLEVLRSGRSRNELAVWFRQWAPNWERGRDPAYARAAQAAAEQRAQVYADIDRLLTPAQRRVALDRLQGYIDDMVALSGSGESRQQRAGN